MEFEGVGVIPMEPPAEEMKPFFIRKFKTAFSITEEEFVSEWIKAIFNNATERKKFAENLKDMVKVAFYLVDINREGKIDHREFDKFYELRNRDCSAAKTLFDAIDSDGDGMISLMEWMHGLMSFFFTTGPNSPFNLFYGPLVED